MDLTAILHITRLAGHNYLFVIIFLRCYWGEHV